MNNIIKAGDVVRTTYKGAEYTCTVTDIIFLSGVLMCRVEPNNYPIPSLLKVTQCTRVDNE